MTLKEKVAEVQPDAVGEIYIGGVKSCPFDYDFLWMERDCPFLDFPVCEKYCRKCWNRKYKEQEVQHD